MRWFPGRSGEVHGRLEERSRNRVLFRPHIRWFRVLFLIACLGGFVALQRPSFGRFRQSFLLLPAALAFEAAFKVAALYSRKCWDAWMDPNVDIKSARRALWSGIRLTLFFLVVLVVMAYMNIIPEILPRFP